MSSPRFQLPNGFGWQYQFILWLQSFHAPWSAKLAIALSYLGTERFYLFLLPLFILAVNRKYGLRLAYVFLTSMFLNSWLKSVFQIARPIGVPGVSAGYLSSSTGSSMPSGHAQGTMTFFVALSKWGARRWILWSGVLLVVLIGLSRIYLGLHWPLDVVVGWAVGLIVGLIGWGLGHYWSYRQVPFRFAILYAILFPAILFYFSQQNPTGEEYATFLLALGTGATLERQWLGSCLDHRWWKRIFIGIIAFAGLIAIQWSLQSYSTELPWRLLRDLLIGWWTTLGAPWLFLKAGLYRVSVKGDR